MPSGVAVDANGDIFIADSSNNRIREVYSEQGSLAGTIITLAGGLIHTSGLVLDSTGDLYFSDSGA